MIIYKPRERFGAFAIFAKALDKPFFAYYNENAVKMRQISTKSMNTVRRGRKLPYAVGRAKVPGEDEESTVQIRRNSHCRKLPKGKSRNAHRPVP